MDRVLHAGEGKIIRRLNRIVGQVNSIEEAVSYTHLTLPTICSV